MKVALDFGLFNNRINGLVEAYYRLSKDLVTSVDVPYVTGFRGQGYNTSQIENKGIELTIEGTPVARNTGTGLSAAISHLLRTLLRNWVQLPAISV